MDEERLMKAYKSLIRMESAEDLREAGFCILDFREAWECWRDLAKLNKGVGTPTFSKNVLAWYRQQGFEVVEIASGGLIFP